MSKLSTLREKHFNLTGEYPKPGTSLQAIQIGINYAESTKKYNDKIFADRKELMTQIIEIMPSVDPVKLASFSLKGNLALQDLKMKIIQVKEVL